MNCCMLNQLLIGAASSNSGKTTFTIGLLRALSNRGLIVQPFKCGPDYIDPMFHSIAAGRQSVNLDTFLSSADHVRNLVRYYSSGTDISVIEGVMGLFDGYDKSKGSSAEIAVLLGAPVVLLINAKSFAYSVAPIIYGYKHFCPRLNVKGVVFNMVASDNHYRLLRDACNDAGVESLGYIRKNPNIVIPNRHLGLTVSERESMEQLITMVTDEIEANVDIDKIISL